MNNGRTLDIRMEPLPVRTARLQHLPTPQICQRALTKTSMVNQWVKLDSGHMQNEAASMVK